MNPLLLAHPGKGGGLIGSIAIDDGVLRWIKQAVAFFQHPFDKDCFTATGRSYHHDTTWCFKFKHVTESHGVELYRTKVIFIYISNSQHFLLH